MPPPPPERVLVPPPPFRFTQNMFFGTSRMIRQQAVTEKRIITFKHNSRLKFFRFFAKLLPLTAVRKCDAIIRLFSKPLRMCREIGMQAYRIVTSTSLVIMS